MKEILKELRVKNRYSQELLAKVLGISRQAYMKYESGEVEPSLEVVRKLCKIYNVTSDYLIYNGEKQKNIEGYNFSKEKTLNVATAVPAYGTYSSINTNSFDSQFAAFSEALGYVQNVISSLQSQLSQLQENSAYGKDKIKQKSYSKSRTFNKEAFFKQIGEVHIDSSYLEESRGNSLI